MSDQPQSEEASATDATVDRPQRTVAHEVSREVIPAHPDATHSRIAIPMNTVADGFKAVLAAVRAMPAAVRLGGGVADTLRRAVKVYRREGLGGLRLRLDYSRALAASPGAIADALITADTSFLDSIVPKRSAVLASPWHLALNGRAGARPPASPMNLSISAVTHCSSRWLAAFFASLESQDFPCERINLIFVDNGSTDDTVGVLEEYRARSGALYRSFQVVEQENLGFGSGHDTAIRRSSDPFVLVVNVDLEFHPNSLAQALAFAQQDEEDIACWEFRQCPHEHPKYYDPVTLETSWCSHACVLLRRSAYLAVGGYDRKIFMYGEDVELSYRLRGAGFRLRYLPRSTITHHVAFGDRTARPHQLSGSIAANVLLRYRYGSQEAIAEGEQLIELATQRQGKADPDSPFAIARRKVEQDREHFRVEFRPARSAPFPFSQFDYDLRRDGHDVPLLPRPAGSRRPLVTVITRTHGLKTGLLSEAIASVINQTYDAIEHIIVEDRTECARALVEATAAAYNRNIVYLKSDGSGRSRAGNCGLAAATGEFVMFLDNDDLLFADHVERLVGRLQDDAKAAAAYSLGWETLTEYGDSGQYVEKQRRIPPLQRRGYDADLLKKSNYIPIQSILFRSALYREYGGFTEDLEHMEDWDLWVRYSAGGDFAFVPKVTSLYRTPYDPKLRAERERTHDRAQDEVGPTVSRRR